MEISNNGLKLTESFEGFISCPYYDSYGQTWTRGYGEAYVNKDSKCVTKHEAEENLRNLMNTRYGKALNDIGIKLNQNQFDASCDFLYNLGIGALEWNFGRSLKEGRYAQAAAHMLEYVYAGGVELPGLVTRRRAEYDLFMAHHIISDPLDVLYPNERKAVEDYLAWYKYPHIHAKAIKKVKKEMGVMRANVWDAAEYGQLKNHVKVKKGWNINNRIKRYKILRKYST